METLSTLLAFCERNPPVTGGFPSQRASNTGDVFCHGSPNELLNKHSSWWWFEYVKHSCDMCSMCNSMRLSLICWQQTHFLWFEYGCFIIPRVFVVARIGALFMLTRQGLMGITWLQSEPRLERKQLTHWPLRQAGVIFKELWSLMFCAFPV